MGGDRASTSSYPLSSIRLSHAPLSCIRRLLTANSLSLSFEITHFSTLAQANYYIDVFSVRYQSKYPHERPLGLGKVPVLNHTSPGGVPGEVSGTAVGVAGRGGGGGGGEGGAGFKSKAS